MSSKLSKEFLQDVMTTAVEGGIDYWAVIRNLKRDGELNVLSFDVRDSEDRTANWEQVDADRVQAAIDHIVAGSVKNGVGDHIVDPIKGAIADPENMGVYIDADVADCIVQVAAYGEIVFG